MLLFTWEKGTWRILKIGKNASKRQVGRDASEIGGQIPIQVSPHVTLVPNIKFRIGGEMPIKGNKGTYDSYDDDDFYLGFAPSGGINCMFKLATRKYLFLGASYEHKIMLIPGESNSMLNFGFVAINLGFVL